VGSRRTSRSTGPVSKHGKTRKTAVPPEVAESPGYAVSQRLRKRIEEGFGWMKTVGGLTQVRVRGLAKIRAAFVFAMAAYNIVRLPKLLAPRGEVRKLRQRPRPFSSDIARWFTICNPYPPLAAPGRLLAIERFDVFAICTLALPPSRAPAGDRGSQ
jgi:hypothetical protein